MQKARVLGYLVGAVAVLIVAVLLAISVWVNPNYYKSTIIAAVKQSTGRDLQLAGDITLSVFPRAALELGAARLGNLPGFGDEPLLAVSHATLRVELLPLLGRRLEVSRIELDGLDVRLRRNAQALGNWQVAPTSASASRQAAGGGRAPPSFGAIANLSIHDGRVSYEDISIEHLNLETGSSALHGDIPVSLTADVHRGPSDAIFANAKFDLNADSTAQHVRLAAVMLNGTLSRPGEDRSIAWEFSAPTLAGNLADASLQAAAFALSYSGAHVSGSVTAAHLLDDATLQASLSLAPLVAREFAPRVGIAIPDTRDPKTWLQLSGSADIEYASKAWTFRNLRVQLDDSQLQGSVKYSAAEIPTVKFDLGVDRIDLDRYRPAKGGDAGHGGRASDAPRGKALFAADGTLAAAAVNFMGMEFTDLRFSAASKDAVTHLFPLEAHLDGGRYSGDITIDDHGAVRSISLNEHLTGIDMARLLAHGAQAGRLSGRATLSLKGNARGESVDALLKTLSGHFEADLAEGAIEGIDLPYERDRAQALLDRTPSARNDTKRTPFDAFRTSAEITNGIAVTHDLTISTQALKVTGQGSANLSTKAIDFQLLANILKSPSQSLIEIPLKVTGTYADPAVKADIGSLAKDQLKQKLKDVLKKNGLQGLFSK